MLTDRFERSSHGSSLCSSGIKTCPGRRHIGLLVGSAAAPSLEERLRGHELHVPAHFDAEVLSALGRLQRAGEMTVRQVTARLQRAAAAPIQRHLLAPLLTGAWKLRHNLRLVDALYVELANRLDASIVTTDARLAAASPAVELLPGGD